MASELKIPDYILQGGITESERVLIPNGTYIANLYQIIQIGTVEDEYKGKKKNLKKVRLSFEIPELLHVFSEEKGEQPLTIHKEFTEILTKDSNLGKFINSWRGVSFTDEELLSFNLSKLVGVNCILNIEEKQSAKGNMYNNILSVSKTHKSMAKYDLINNPIVLSYMNFDWNVFDSLPNFIKEKMSNTPEFKNLPPRLQTEANEVADMDFSPIQDLTNE